MASYRLAVAADFAGAAVDDERDKSLYGIDLPRYFKNPSAWVPGIAADGRQSALHLLDCASLVWRIGRCRCAQF